MASLAPADLWRVLRQNLPRVPFAEDVVAAYYCATDPRTPASAKAILLAALGYFVLPVDLIPDVLPVIGFTDDAAVIAAAIATVRRFIMPDHYDRAREALRKVATV